MKVRGIVRKIDNLGRLTVPKEYLRSLGKNAGDEMEMFLTETGIEVRIPDLTTCTVCDTVTDNVVGNTYICLKCKEQIIKGEK